MTDQTYYKYRDLIRNLLDWNRVQCRLDRYSNIRRCFPYSFLSKEKYTNESPYFSHFLAWRLGVWNKENAFEHLDELLAHAYNMVGWKEKSCRNRNPEFEAYFGFLWELQVAKALSVHPDYTVEWLPSGPDFRVKTNGDTFYVECTTYQKSFAIEAFIEDVLCHYLPDIRVVHGRCMIFTLPKDTELADLLEELFTLLMNEKFVERCRAKAETVYPVRVPVPDAAPNLFVHFYSNNPTVKCKPYANAIHSAGDTDAYLQNAIFEIACQKKCANNLSAHRPNLVVVNLGLSWDAQTAIYGKEDFSLPLPEPTLPESIDGLLITACGNDSIPELENSYTWIRDKKLAVLWNSK